MQPQTPANLPELIESVLSRRQECFDALIHGEGDWRLILLLLELIFICTAFYGVVMGAPGGWKQAAASAVKVPLLFLASLAICLPALYVITTLSGSRLPLVEMASLILFALAVTSVILASLATIAGFFAASGSQYDFMKILHVAAFAFSGVWGMLALSEGVSLLTQKSAVFPGIGMSILRVWIALFAFVGAQMAWSLRPFIGAPGLPFELLRKRAKGLNFYTAIAASLRRLQSSGRKKRRPGLASARLNTAAQSPS